MTISTGGGDVYVLAGSATADGMAGVDMADGTTLSSGGGSVRVEALGGTGDILLSAINAGAGNVGLVAHNDILDNTAAELANVTAAGLLMVADADNAAGGTIGEPDVLGVRTPAVNVKAIDTAVATLAASSDEGIYVLEADAVTVTQRDGERGPGGLRLGGDEPAADAGRPGDDGHGGRPDQAGGGWRGRSRSTAGGTAVGVSADGTGDVLLEARGGRAT